MLLTVIGGDGVQAAKADQSTAASTGIECEAEFVVMCDSVHRRDPDEIAVARGALLEALGGDMNKLIDSVCIMAFFNGIADRTADATGLQVESNRAQTSIRFADKSSRLLSSSSSPLVQGGRSAITVAGFASCPFHQTALEAAAAMKARGDCKEVHDMTFASRDEYREWLLGATGRSAFSSKAAAEHTSSPCVWMTPVNSEKHSFIGGCDDLVELAAAMESAQQQASAKL